MSLKQLMTAALLTFVAVSMVWLVLGDEGESARTVALQDPSAETVESPGGSADKTGALPMPDHRVVAYYFHGNVRCPTCLAIEQGAKEALSEGFADSLENGLLEWKSVNTDEPENEHFLKDFELSFSSVVIVESSGEKTLRWANLHKVWQLVHDKAAFHEYVRNETGQYLEAL